MDTARDLARFSIQTHHGIARQCTCAMGITMFCPPEPFWRDERNMDLHLKQRCQKHVNIEEYGDPWEGYPALNSYYGRGCFAAKLSGMSHTLIQFVLNSTVPKTNPSRTCRLAEYTSAVLGCAAAVTRFPPNVLFKSSVFMFPLCQAISGSLVYLRRYAAVANMNGNTRCASSTMTLSL